MIPAFQNHCLPYADFVRRIPELSAEFTHLSGIVDPRPSNIREFIKQRNYSLSDDHRVCRATLAAFAAYMRDFHNCKLRLSGFFQKGITISQGAYSSDFFDLFYRVMFEGLDIPENLKDKQLIEHA